MKTENWLIKNVAGVDEAGRGPLAGPVVAAAVILDPERPIEGLADSKRLTEKKREILFDTIQSQSHSWAIAQASVEEIDRLNILQATLLAMQRAVAALSCVPEHVYIDGNRCPELPCSAEAVIKGDSLVASISAASILAKVTRDRYMIDLAKKHPGYGFEGHKGYPTAKHIASVRELGVTEHHRRSFAPIKSLISVVSEV